MNKLSLAFCVLIYPPLALAGEQIEGTNYYIDRGKQWSTGDQSGYWISDNKGVSDITTGPLEPVAVECHGGGFWDAGGVWGEGICIYGEGDDTYIMAFQLQKGQDSTWRFVHGSGKYAGITGSGTFNTSRLGASRRVTHWKGEVELPN